MKKFLGLDIGDRRIGLAISDDLNLTAQGLDTISRKGIKKDVKKIKDIIKEKNIETLVVGMPFRTDNNTGQMKSQQGKKIDIVIQQLRKQIDIPIVLQDERFTTKESERILAEANIKKEQHKKIKDKISAQLILQTFLDKL